MFTVMHEKDGVQTFYRAVEVSYRGPFAHPGSQGLGVVTPDRDVSHVLHGGNAYVMNEGGATVAKYNLPDHDGSEEAKQRAKAA